jgi:hypothetical protein
MIIEDVLSLSEKELTKIETNIQFSRHTLDSNDLKDLNEFYKLLDLKCYLINQQNCLVRSLYPLLLSLKDEFLKKESKIARRKNLKSIPYLEFKYTEYIIKFLTEVEKVGYFEDNLTIEQKKQIEVRKEEFKIEKKKIVEILESRSKLAPEKMFNWNLKPDQIKRFSYGKKQI